MIFRWVDLLPGDLYVSATESGWMILGVEEVKSASITCRTHRVTWIALFGPAIIRQDGVFSVLYSDTQRISTQAMVFRDGTMISPSSCPNTSTSNV